MLSKHSVSFIPVSQVVIANKYNDKVCTITHLIESATDRFTYCNLICSEKHNIIAVT